MHKDFYYFGIFFFGLSVLAALFLSIMFFQIGYLTYQLESFGSWFWVEVGLALITYVILLQYFKQKSYRLVYTIFMISIIASVIQYFTTYLFVVLMMREIMTFHLISIVISMLTSLVFGISLIVSKAVKSPWLKTEGVLFILLTLVSAFVLIWSLNLLGMQLSANVEIVSQWVNLAASLMPVPLIVLFYKEHKALSGVQSTGRLKYAELMSALGGILILSGLVIAMKMSQQSYWYTHVSPEEQALVDKFESKTFTDSKDNSLDYLFMKPLEYDSTQNYPLVICLHGGPKSAKLKRVIVTEPAPLLSKPLNREKYPAFLFVPQAPPGKSWGGMPYAQPIDALLMETIDALKAEYEIDENRIYLTGISMGGFGTWYLAGTHADMFAAAIPMCGIGDTALATEMVDIPVWAFHGSEDKNVPVSGSRNMIAAIKEAGGDPKYTEFPEVAHHVWPHVQETEGVLDWLFAQKRE
ncbi:carboxylesterase family protein [Catalinimonas niigatensis]|uniref:carboxylesterase family protein n=1 Tax=Catalinimonas niigatensis TaxID=1397264 RepID=UPI002666AB0E|nr:prolyl oligopeptidase family serine peptidase [Catalinimonas niigatensis]WPP51382.1 prolyl oligopeptidase family serine peptidase [Catalinimonas niigatensis]